MIPGDANHPDPRLEAYLDGTLSPEERIAFERDAGADGELARQVTMQRQLDASLRRLYTPPLAPVIPDVPAAPASPTRNGHPRTPRVTPDPGPKAPPAWVEKLAAAAILGAAITLGVWSFVQLGGTDAAWWRKLTGAPPAQPYAYTAAVVVRGSTIEEAYRNTVAAGFTPGWVCSQQQQFIHTFADRLGQPMTMDETPDVRMVGLSYGSTATGTVVVLTRAYNVPVLVFAERTDRLRAAGAEPACWDYTLPADSGLHLHRREVGALTLFEVSPLDRATAVERMRQP